MNYNQERFLHYINKIILNKGDSMALLQSIANNNKKHICQFLFSRYRTEEILREYSTWSGLFCKASELKDILPNNGVNYG